MNYTDEFCLLKDVTVTNSSSKADFETVQVNTEDMLDPDKDDMEDVYIPEIKKRICSTNMLVAMVTVFLKNFNMLDMVIGL